VIEVFRLQLATDPLLKTTNAKTAAHRLHASLCPNGITDSVDFGVGVYGLFDALRVGVECLL
jgi:hypothetical protein